MSHNIVVLVSGHGSNLQALIEAMTQWPCELQARICAVFSNRAQAYALHRAQQAGIATHVLKPSAFVSREMYDQALADQIAHYQPDLIILAGYMRILTPHFIERFAGRILNIHPSLLPRHPGLDTHRKVLEEGDNEHGTTVHFVTEELDGGPVILQARIHVHPSDTETSLRERIQKEEHRIYPLAALWFLQGKLRMQDGIAYMEGVPLPAQGVTAFLCER